MAIRFVRETQFDCILVSIKDGRVEWSWKKDEGRRVWLTNGQRIRPGSIAWEIHEGRLGTEGMEEVDAHAWFDHLPFQFSGEVQEHSIEMPSYNSIFTLLWES